MTEAVARAKPRIDHPAELARLVDDIVREIRPVAIYLFGSRARGDADEHSDYDLMVVVKDEHWRPGIAGRLHDIGRSRRFAKELIPTRASAYAWRRNEVGTLQYEAETDGIQLFPKHRRAFPASARDPRCMNVNIVEEWLGRVRKDLTAALKCCEGDDAVPDQSAYHVQQAAEKLVKGALVAHLIRPGKGHKIEEFAPLLPDSFPLRQRFIVLEQFSKYAWAHRYPLYPGQPEVPEPSVADVTSWIEQVAELKSDFERWLEGHASDG